MRKSIGIAFLLLMLVFPLEAANKIPNITEIEKLAATAKVWGFLKYYHPAVANGSLDWDEELLKKIAEVEMVESKKELSELFLHWIGDLGEVPKVDHSKEEAIQDMFTKNFDLTWIESGVFSRKLGKKLRFFEKNRFRGNHYYVTAEEQVGNAVFTNENAYDSFKWEEKNLRLLALFRYWNQVAYFFPYKYQMDKDWEQVLEEKLPLFLNAASEIEYHLAMQELVASLDDSHAHLITAALNSSTGYYWAPVKLKMIEDKPVVVEYLDKTFAMEDNWNLGDILVAVNNVPVSEILKNKKKYFSGSNRASKFGEIHVPLLNGNSNSVEVEIHREGQQLRRTVKRYYKRQFRPDNSAEKWKLLDRNIGYVDLGNLEREDVDQMFKEFKDTNGIILDARNYPRGTWYAIATHLHKTDFEVAKSLVPVLEYPGKFRFTESPVIAHDNPDAYEGKVVLLMDEYTQSQAEYTVMALQTAPYVTTIGRPTSGANGNVTDVSFVGGFTTYMSGIGVFYPDGRETQRIGLLPDIEVETTLQGIKNGEDEILTRALEFFTEK